MYSLPNIRDVSRTHSTGSIMHLICGHRQSVGFTGIGRSIDTDEIEKKSDGVAKSDAMEEDPESKTEKEEESYDETEEEVRIRDAAIEKYKDEIIDKLNLNPTFEVYFPQPACELYRLWVVELGEQHEIPVPLDIQCVIVSFLCYSTNLSGSVLPDWGKLADFAQHLARRTSSEDVGLRPLSFAPKISKDRLKKSKFGGRINQTRMKKQTTTMVSTLTKKTIKDDGSCIDQELFRYDLSEAWKMDIYVELVLELIRGRIADRIPPSSRERSMMVSLYRNYLIGLRDALSHFEYELMTEESRHNITKSIEYRTFKESLIKCELIHSLHNPLLFYAYERVLKNHFERCCLAALNHINEGVMPILDDEIIMIEKQMDNEEENNKQIFKDDRKELQRQRLFWMKSKSDFYRYLAEHMPGEKKMKYRTLAQKCYDVCLDTAKQEFEIWEDIYLNIHLNYGVFLSDILFDLRKAIEICVKTMEESEQNWDKLSERSRSVIYPMIRDNIQFWKMQLREKDLE